MATCPLQHYTLSRRHTRECLVQPDAADASARGGGGCHCQPGNLASQPLTQPVSQSVSQASPGAKLLLCCCIERTTPAAAASQPPPNPARPPRTSPAATLSRSAPGLRNRESSSHRPAGGWELQPHSWGRQGLAGGGDHHPV